MIMAITLEQVTLELLKGFWVSMQVFGLTLLFSFLLRFVERKLDGNANYELVQDDSLTMTAGTYSHPKRGSNYDEQSKDYAGKLKKGGK